MNYLRNSLKPLLYIFTSMLILTFLITILNYFNIINYGAVTIIKIIIPILSLFIGGYLIGKKSISKGWLAGLKLALIFLLLLSLFNFFGLNSNVEITDLVYYLILTISTMFGSMIGINRRKMD